MITISPMNNLPNIRHGFFTRAGGISGGLYASLNCGFGSKDDPANVAANRRRAMAMIDLPPEALVTVRQEHTAQAVVVDQEWTYEQAPVADAMVTTRYGLALGILTADCAPVLFADSEAGVIGAAHAGWRGAKAGVIEATVTAMVGLGASPARIVAAIGPCIAQRSYEVGPEFPGPFLTEDRDNALFFASSHTSGRHKFDLGGYVARRINRLGIQNVVRTPGDTVLEETRFFSYRRATLRGESDYGRGLSSIVLER
ncbi:MAG: peptidoglycan editing factor PgeF [Alphaproteobacteria bacterium]|nr:peptidoglycan editing factor PgeF [Alphaproteobacteria bacterium]